MLQVFADGFTAVGVVGVWLEETSTRPDPVVSCKGTHVTRLVKRSYFKLVINNTIMDHSLFPELVLRLSHAYM